MTAAVPAFISDQKGVRDVVNFKIDDNTCRKPDLTSLLDGYSGRNGVETVVRSIRRSTCTGVSSLNLAVSATTITIHIVSVITAVDESFCISAKFEADAGLRVKNKFWPAGLAGIAVRATETAIGTGQAHSVIRIEVGSY